MVLSGESGAPLITVPVYGTGVGPQTTFPPGTQTNLGFTASSVAVDGTGNLYVTTPPICAVYKETLQPDGSYTETRFPAGGGWGSCYLALDGSGNLYISNPEVFKLTLQANGSYTQTTIGIGFTNPGGLAVDGSGNVYVADQSLVREEALQADGSYTQTPICAGVNFVGVAVDGSGNVYVADQMGPPWDETVNGAIWVEDLQSNGSYTRTNIGTVGSSDTDWRWPGGLAVDGVGNVYVSDYPPDWNNVRLSQAIRQPNGGYAVNQIATVPGDPAGVAVDGSGNVYVAPSGAVYGDVYKENYAGAPSLTFAGTMVGEVSAPQQVTVQNRGNSPLTISEVGVTTNFSLDASGTTCSASGQLLAQSASCVLSIEFSPTEQGAVTGGVVLTSNNLNATGTQQTITLQGNATTGNEAQTITFANPGTQTYGTPLTLTAAASSGLAVGFASATTSVCTVSGNTATFVIAGTCTIQATQAGNSSYLAATPVSHSFTVNPEAQTITFPAIPTTTFATGSVTLNATAASGLPVSYASTNTSVCTVSASTVTLLSVGTCGIWATQAGNGGFSAAPEVGHAFAVTIAAQTITFPNPGTQTYGEAPYNLGATASSNLPVSYASTTSSICTVSASTVTLLATGTCGIVATQAGNSDYAAAAAVGMTFQVIKNQIITFPAIPTTTLVTGSVTLNATATSHLPVSYASTNTSVCTVSGSTVTLLTVGTCVITATQAGNGIAPPAPQVGHAFEVTLATQTITFSNPGTQTVGGAPFTLNATASSNLPVSYSYTNKSVCTVIGNTATLQAPGYCGIWATQAGNTYYAAAAEVGHIFLVAKEAQTITFPNPGAQFPGVVVMLNATASSGLPVSYSSTTPSVCTVSGIIVTMVTVGSCGILASQAGNGDYAPAPTVGHLFFVAKKSQFITFPNPGTQTRGTTVTLDAAASSGLPVSFTSLTPSVCTVSGSTLTLLPLTFHADCGIVATQAGDAYYAPAPEVGHMFFVDILWSY